MSHIYKQVKREIERDRAQAEKKLAARQKFLREKLPGIKEIDDELSSIGLNLAKLVLLRSFDSEKVKQLKSRNKLLLKQKEILLYENGYDDAYFDDVFICTKCRDTGFLDNERCYCFKQRVIEKYYEMSNLSKKLEFENFESFNMNYYSDVVDITSGMSPRDNMARIWSGSQKFIKNFDVSFENLLLHGKTGLGKTFLSNCIAKELLDKGKTVLYTSAAGLFKTVEDARFNREENEDASAFLAMVPIVDLLIIDDLGTEFATTVTNSELFNIINTRLLNKKSTIISTNLDPRHLEDYYNDRITSRIYGEYTVMHFIGEDIRVAKKHGL